MKITDHPTITSKENVRLKLARTVRDGRDRSYIFVEGARLAKELLQSSIEPVFVFLSEDSQEKHRELLNELASSSAAEVLLVKARSFGSISDTENSQGIIVLANRPPERSFADSVDENGLFVYLNKVNNPSNLGAVLRTAEAAGASGVVTSPGSTDIYSPKALRASMGSAFRLPVFTSVGLREAIDVVHRLGIRTIAADVSGKESYTEADWRGGRMLVLGSEAHGLEADELTLVDQTILIPMENAVESLNLAVSAGIILFEAKRQRKASALPDLGV